MKPRAAATGEPIPRPEIFWTEDGSGEPLRAPIAKIYVYANPPTGGREQIDCTTIDALPDPVALRNLYGPGMYDLEARDVNGGLVAKATHRVRMPPGQQWRPPAGAPAVEVVPPTQGPQAASSGRLDPLTAMLMGHVLTLSTKLSEIQATSSNQVLDAVTRMSAARLTDAQDLFGTLLKQKAGANGGSPEDIRKVYEAGMKKATEFFEFLGEHAEGSEDANPLELMKTFLEGFREFKAMDSNAAPNNVVSMPPRK